MGEQKSNPNTSLLNLYIEALKQLCASLFDKNLSSATPASVSTRLSICR